MFAFLTASFTAFFSAGVNCDLFATSVSSGAFTSLDTVLSLPNVFGCSPGFVTVTLPSLSTAIWSSVRPGFAFLTASLIACFSSGVKFAGSFTATFAGSTNSAPGVVSSFSIVSSGPSVAVFVTSWSLTVSFTVTVTLPLSSTLIWSSVNVGLTSFTASFTAFCSSGVSFCGSLTLTGLGLFNVNFEVSSTTVSFWDRVPVLSPSVTTTEPSSATSIFAFSDSVGFAFLTASLTFSFSSAVNSLMFCTGVFSGATSLIVLSASVAASIVWLGSKVPFLESVIGTVTVPLSSTWISSSEKSSSGLAFLIASLTFCFSSSVILLVSPTFTFSAGGFSCLPSLVNGFTVSSAFRVPVLLPSLTVTLPLLSTSIFAVSGKLFFVLTAAATFSLSAFVKLVGSFTSTFWSGAVKSSIVSFCTTVFSAGIVPTLPPWLISTVPSGLTVISLSFRFLSLLASFTACLISAISLGFNSPILSTFTGSLGGLKLFWTSFCLTVLSGANVPVLPSLVFTVTVPSSATVTSASVIPLSLLASTTAFLTLSISSDVSPLRSFTSTGVGSFSCNGSLSFFSQTAYTVLGAVTPVNIVSSAVSASFVAAQPLNLYPSFVGSFATVTVPSTALAVCSSFPSSNLPPLASSVTVTSAE